MGNLRTCRPGNKYSQDKKTSIVDNSCGSPQVFVGIQQTAKLWIDQRRLMTMMYDDDDNKGRWGRGRQRHTIRPIILLKHTELDVTEKYRSWSHAEKLRYQYGIPIGGYWVFCGPGPHVWSAEYPLAAPQVHRYPWPVSRISRITERWNWIQTKGQCSYNEVKRLHSAQHCVSLHHKPTT